MYLLLLFSKVRICTENSTYYDTMAYAPEHQYQYNQLIDGGRDDDEDNGVFGLD